MNIDYVKNGMWYASRALFVASTVLTVLTVTRVSGFMTSSSRITKTVNTAKAQNGHDEETVTNFLKKGHKTAGQLKNKNMFVTPPPKPKAMKKAASKAAGKKIGPQVAERQAFHNFLP